jgi:hypothetical protein
MKAVNLTFEQKFYLARERFNIAERKLWGFAKSSGPQKRHQRKPKEELYSGSRPWNRQRVQH